MENLNQAPQIITDQLTQAQEHLDEIKALMARFDLVDTTKAWRAALERQDDNGRATILCAVPSREGFESRAKHGPSKYLYLYFGKQRFGNDYAGPVGAKGKRVRKVYGGHDSENYARARQLVENRRRWERLHSAATILESWISRTTSRISGDIDGLVTRSREWARMTVELDRLQPAPIALFEAAAAEIAASLGAGS
jgi:hypothetical protein